MATADSVNSHSGEAFLHVFAVLIADAFRFPGAQVWAPSCFAAECFLPLRLPYSTNSRMHNKSVPIF